MYWAYNKAKNHIEIIYIHTLKLNKPILQLISLGILRIPNVGRASSFVSYYGKSVK